ncbi:oligosaccharide flippase family protein [Paenibacillus sp. GCM10023248]|uniref:oligosaccharide flippase family protein n=1 Tax=unclassified Paenibacillus TaxID=185978 RepID=UPI002379EB50|nr:oligosaccharide flippase family protein [Paenibacillus sp. MAHUQ-63]MDD9266226.1 oligosaccharide flippase family protein [Paenibacillus sp. MAHUQ-63]
MQKPRTLRSNFSWTLLGNVVYAACQWGLLMSMAKIGTAHMVGEFSLGLAVTAPIFMLSNLQLSGILATDAKSSQSFENYLGLRMCTTLIALVIIIFLVLLGRYQFETSLIIILIGIAKGSESISDVIFGLLQKNEKMERVAISLMLKGILSLVVLCILLWTTNNLVLGIVGYVISSITVLLLYDISVFRQYKIKLVFDLSKLWSLVRVCLPLGFVMMLVSLNANIPRYFIEHYIGIESVGYFAALSYIMIAGNTVISALGQSVSPRLARYYSILNMKGFKKLLFLLVVIGFIVGAIGWVISLLFSKEILTLLYKPNYAEYTSVFILIMFGAWASYIASFLGYGMTATRKFKIQPLLFIIVTIVCTISNAVLIPFKGLEGASYAMIITNLTQLVGSGLIIINIIQKQKIESVS